MDLNHNSVKLLLTHADVALKLVGFAETTEDQTRRKRAMRYARGAYEEILQKRPQFSLSDVEARLLDIKLAQLKTRLERLGKRFGP
jgi:hypothetical protein